MAIDQIWNSVMPKILNISCNTNGFTICIKPNILAAVLFIIVTILLQMIGILAIYHVLSTAGLSFVVFIVLVCLILVSCFQHFILVNTLGKSLSFITDRNILVIKKYLYRKRLGVYNETTLLINIDKPHYDCFASTLWIKQGETKYLLGVFDEDYELTPIYNRAQLIKKAIQHIQCDVEYIPAPMRRVPAQERREKAEEPSEGLPSEKGGDEAAPPLGKGQNDTPLDQDDAKKKNDETKQ